MTINEGITDRVLRITAGFLILSAFFLVEGNARWFALIGFVPFITGLIGWCPLYSLVGLRSCAAEER